jgi:hypothetical protein
MDNFITEFNKVSFDQTKSILEKADKEAYANYTSNMLSYLTLLGCKEYQFAN